MAQNRDFHGGGGGGKREALDLNQNGTHLYTYTANEIYVFSSPFSDKQLFQLYPNLTRSHVTLMKSRGDHHTRSIDLKGLSED